MCMIAALCLTIRCMDCVSVSKVETAAAPVGPDEIKIQVHRVEIEGEMATPQVPRQTKPRYIVSYRAHL